MLPSPTGPLSKEVPATAITAANKEVMKCLKHSEDEKRVKNAVAALTRTFHETVTTIEEKKRGRPSMLPKDITSHLAKYIHAIRDAGGIINTAIVIAAGMGIVKKVNPALLECNGGYVVL